MQDENGQPKLDKALLGKVVRHAHREYLNRGYSDGSSYLDAKEILALAYCIAFLSVLESEGYTVVRKPVSKK